MIESFSDCAEDCIRLAQRATSQRDRDLFLELASAWYGITAGEPPAAGEPRSRPH